MIHQFALFETWGPPELLLLAGIGLIPAFIARSKGHSFVGWWIFGALLFIVALIAVLIIKPTPAARLRAQGIPLAAIRPCPACMSPIPRASSVCSSCGSTSPAWTFHNGMWWSQDDAGGWFYYEEDANKWHPAAESNPQA
jgi:hypothetical protein